jgi:hypothetical protein
MEYIPVSSMSALVKKFNEESKNADENDFVEGLVFSESSGVVLKGKMIPSADPAKVRERLNL